MIHISTLNGKLAEFRAISVNTLTNDFCKMMHNVGSKNEIICTFCYSWALLQGFRKNIAEALQRNTEILSKKILDKKDLPFINDAYFRFNAHGELINSTHLKNLVNIARLNSGTTFALWSKRKGIVKDFFSKNKMPKNLILVYSNPKINNVGIKVPPFFHKVFNNVEKNHMVEKQNCTGQRCKDCLMCYNKNNGKDIIIEGVKNYG